MSSNKLIIQCDNDQLLQIPVFGRVNGLLKHMEVSGGGINVCIILRSKG